MAALIEMLGSYTSPVTNPPDYGYLQYEIFFNHYPLFQDTNNLSQVLFLEYPGVSMIFPGDLEKAGWKSLLRNVSFRERLAKVNIFVASHHGRESGYLENIFEYCEPNIVIISDEAKQYETQEMDYGFHAKGVPWDSGGARFVLTTRNDGMISIKADVFGPTRIETSKG
jgi:beta-lactamase superfamily II metal-dependent hydrolase